VYHNNVGHVKLKACSVQVAVKLDEPFAGQIDLAQSAQLLGRDEEGERLARVLCVTATNFEEAATPQYLVVKDVEKKEALAAAVRELHKRLAH
jgi:hypothetical protein